MKDISIVLTVDEIKELVAKGHIRVKREVKNAPAWGDPDLVAGYYEKKGGRKVYGLMYKTQRWPCPFGKPGMRLIVKEEWNFGRDEKGNLTTVFRADGETCGGWRDGKTMPDDYSRFSVLSMNGGIEKGDKDKTYWFADLSMTFTI